MNMPMTHIIMNTMNNTNSPTSMLLWKELYKYYNFIFMAAVINGGIYNGYYFCRNNVWLLKCPCPWWWIDTIHSQESHYNPECQPPGSRTSVFSAVFPVMLLFPSCVANTIVDRVVACFAMRVRRIEKKCHRISRRLHHLLLHCPNHRYGCAHHVPAPCAKP